MSLARQENRCQKGHRQCSATHKLAPEEGRTGVRWAAGFARGRARKAAAAQYRHKDIYHARAGGVQFLSFIGKNLRRQHSAASRARSVCQAGESQTRSPRLNSPAFEWAVSSAGRLNSGEFSYCGPATAYLERIFAPGETIQVDTGRLVALQPSVSYDIGMVGGFKNTLFGGEGCSRRR